MELTVIIPSYNDVVPLRRCLDSLLPISPATEIIVADASADNYTAELVSNYLAVRYLGVKTPSRALQMNAAAAIARGRVLCFLHADSICPPYLEHFVLSAIERPGVVAGAFRFALDTTRWWRVIIEAGVFLRSRLFSLPYGDQGIFLLKNVFEQLGGYQDRRAEDLHLILKLRKIGKIALLWAPIKTSARKWQEQGVVSCTYRNSRILIGELQAAMQE